MMVAYLHGMLKPKHAYGLTSIISESIILELVSSTLAGDDYRVNAMADTVRLLLTEPKALQEAAQSVDARMRRANELKFGNIFRDVGERSNKNTPSLYQLYQIAQSSGIMEALREYQPSMKPLLRG